MYPITINEIPRYLLNVREKNTVIFFAPPLFEYANINIKELYEFGMSI